MAKYQEEDIKRFYEIALELVTKAGNVVNEAIEKEKKISVKSKPCDLVTETDKAVEKLLVEGLK